MSAMNRYLAGVLSVIAVGVTVIAYTLVVPRDARPASMAMPAGAASMAVPAGMTGTMAPADGMVMQPAAGQYLVTGPNGERWVTTLPGAPGTLGTTAGYAGYTAMPLARPVSQVSTVSDVEMVTPRTVTRAPRRVVQVERAPRRDWVKTALVIGGTTAASAGVGGIFGGKKGALIGAAIGGGASTIYETTKR